ncbi:hypothetical protein AB0383_21010 [Amycolatopsis sp. NPDC051373]|uniref:hypothetical protein n=1 Tax=Amycolatopsis sp. NPDC051373 TaxID=3155801 RepID=UPI00344ED67C
MVTEPEPNYVDGSLPGLIVAGAGAGLVQAPLFARRARCRLTARPQGPGCSPRRARSAARRSLRSLSPFASAPSGSLVGYHRGFLFMAIACFAATITVLATNPRTR